MVCQVGLQGETKNWADWMLQSSQDCYKDCGKIANCKCENLLNW